MTDSQARDAAAPEFHFNALLATLNLVRGSEIQAADTHPLPVFSVASSKQQKFNERLVETLISKLDLEPTSIKKHPQHEEIRTYGAILDDD